MRKLLTIFACCCLLLLVCGHGLVYFLKRAEIRTAVRKDLLLNPAQNLQTFSCTATQLAGLAWEADDEFEYKGRMYDVVRMESTGSITTIYCIADEKESALIDAYLQLQKKGGSSSSGTLLKLLSLQFLSPATHHDVALTALDAKRYSPFICLIAFMEQQIICPPPKAA